MGTKKMQHRRIRRGRARGFAPFVAFALLFAFALGQGSSLTAFANDSFDVDGLSAPADADGSTSAASVEGTSAGELPADDAAAEESGTGGEDDGTAAVGPAGEDTEAAGHLDQRTRKITGKGTGSSSDGSAVGSQEAQQQEPDEPGAPSGNGVQPVLLVGNQNCGEVLGDDLLFEYRDQAPADATVDLAAESGGLVEGTLEIDVHDETLFDFTIVDGDPLAAVVVKGGSNANLFDYRPDGEVADTDLHAPLNPENDQYYGLSHISFCWAKEAPQPEIDVTKSCPASVEAGDDIEYTITVENTGNEPLVDVTVDDTLLGDITGDFDFDFSQPFPAGEVATAVVTYQQQAGDPDPITNTVTATGTGADSGAEATDTASCTTDIVHVPGIAVRKSCPAQAGEGDTITYSITVSNTGNEALEDVTVMDSVLGDLSDSFGNTLDVGDSETQEFDYTVPEGGEDPLVNIVAVSGSGVDSGTTVTGTATCSTDILHPAISIVKTVSEETVAVGDTVTYTYVVTNTGDTTLFDISVDDDVLGHIGDIDVLEPGDSATLTKDFVVGDEVVRNIAIARGHDILGRVVEASDDAIVTPILGTSPTPTPPTTPFTGSDAGWLGLIAALAIGVGLTVIAATRRRRSGETT
jgi:uncharacterized repeat protein (TIGR01451 family)